MQAADAENAIPRKHKLRGFPTVVAFVPSDSDNTSFIFRRFNKLSARNLLYLQSRLQQLEVDQAVLDEEDLENGDIQSKKAATSWEDFEASAKQRERERKRMEIAEQNESLIKRYHKALLLQERILRLEHLPSGTLKAFKSLFEPSPGRTELRGHSSRILEDEDDLVTLRIPPSRDRLTKLIQSYFPWLFLDDNLQGRAAIVSEKKLIRFVSFLSTVLAATLLIGAVITLCCVRSPAWQLAIVVIFTCLFAASVGLLSNSGRTEVYTATAAYAAVLVVFISGNGPAHSP